MNEPAADRLRPHPDVVSQRLGDSGVLIDLRTGRMFELNATGLRVWELVNDGCPAADLADRLRQEFTGDPDRLRDEVTALVDELVPQGRLTIIL